MTTHFQVRSGSVQGTNHSKHHINNQDAVQTQEFGVAKHDKTYYTGMISDGCSGIPAFSRNEVGANLIVTYCQTQIQRLVLTGMKVADIPGSLYPMLVTYLNIIAQATVADGTHWPYELDFPANHAFRNKLGATKRFTLDYLAATAAGFIDDGETLVVFRADDGIMAADDKLFVIDQNNQPDYPALTPGGSFAVDVFVSAEVNQLCLATDGAKELLEMDELGLPDAFFSHQPENPQGLSVLLRNLRKKHGEKMGDDCTVLTRKRLEVS